LPDRPHPSETDMQTRSKRFGQPEHGLGNWGQN
jgi:hypothetical protein